MAYMELESSMYLYFKSQHFSRLENNQPDIIPNVSSGTKIETIIFYMIAVYLHSPNILRTAFLVLSLLVLVGLSYLLRDWRDLQLAFTLTSLLPLSFLALQESPRWLLAKGKHQEAAAVLR